MIRLYSNMKIFLCYNCRHDNNTFGYNFHMVVCVLEPTWGVKWPISVLPPIFFPFWLFLLMYEQNPSRYEPYNYNTWEKMNSVSKNFELWKFILFLFWTSVWKFYFLKIHVFCTLSEIFDYHRAIYLLPQQNHTCAVKKNIFSKNIFKKIFQKYFWKIFSKNIVSLRTTIVRDGLSISWSRGCQTSRGCVADRDAGIPVLPVPQKGQHWVRGVAISRNVNASKDEVHLTRYCLCLEQIWNTSLFG